MFYFFANVLGAGLTKRTMQGAADTVSQSAIVARSFRVYTHIVKLNANAQDA